MKQGQDEKWLNVYTEESDADVHPWVEGPKHNERIGNISCKANLVV